MLLSWLDARLARVGLTLAIIAISILCVLPTKEVPVGSGWDKFDHWSAFFTLSLLANHAFLRKPFWQIAIALVLYGIGIEVAQSFTPDRSADIFDVIADSIGILIYGFILALNTILIKARIGSE